MRLRRALFVLPLVSVFLLVLLYFAVDYWLESAGGRRALERTLGEKIGVPVHLNGDFNIRLLPSVGVSGTELVISDPDSGRDLARGGFFETDLALAPLFREELQVRQVVVEDLMLNAPDGGGLFVPRLVIGTFQVGKPSEFLIDLSWLGVFEGRFTWQPDESLVELELRWRADERDDIAYRGPIRYQAGLVRFGPAKLAIGSQALDGQGCLLFADRPELNLDLQADRLDIDALMANLPGGEGAAGALPIQLNLRLEAAEVRQGETVAFDTLLELGEPPRCP